MIGGIKDWFKETKRFLPATLFAIWIFAMVAAVNYVIGNYVSMRDGTIIQDLILDNIPTINLSGLFIWGILIIFFILFFYPLFFEPKYLPIVIFQLALLILIRSFFITLTSTQLPTPNFIIEFPPIIDNWNFKNNLFFSGHTAIPFLGYLIFQREKVGKIFLVASVIMGATVLLTKLHYSIDVFAAFFITYASYRIGVNLLRKKPFRIIKNH